MTELYSSFSLECVGIRLKDFLFEVDPFRYSLNVLQILFVFLKALFQFEQQYIHIPIYNVGHLETFFNNFRLLL